MNTIGRDSARAQAQESFVGLLGTPLLAARIQPTVFAGVLRHRALVSDWAARLGYRLVIAGGVARLHRDPAVPACTAAPPPWDPPARRDLVLLALAAAACEDTDSSGTVQELSDEVRALSAGEKRRTCWLLPACRPLRLWTGRPGAGLPRAGTGQLLELASRCAVVWPGLPASGGSTVLLTVLAAEALGDPHALDRGSPVAAGVLRLLGYDVPATAESWRATWDEIGVVCDPVSSRVLVLNLVLRGGGAACRLTGAAGAEPLWLTWRSLTGTVGSDAPDVYVCENPSVLIAAADQLGTRSLPLVCTNGHPSAATRRLLGCLAGGGAVLHVRAADDTAGREIVSGLNVAIPGMRLWRYSLEASPRARYEEQDLELLLRDLDGDR
jgi:hypothetical protein